MISGNAIVSCLKSFEYKPSGGVVLRQPRRRVLLSGKKTVTKFIKNNFTIVSEIIESQPCIVASHIRAWTSNFFFSYKNLNLIFNTKGFITFFGGAFLRFGEVV